MSIVLKWPKIYSRFPQCEVGETKHKKTKTIIYSYTYLQKQINIKEMLAGDPKSRVNQRTPVKIFNATTFIVASCGHGIVYSVFVIVFVVCLAASMTAFPCVVFRIWFPTPNLHNLERFFLSFFLFFCAFYAELWNTTCGVGGNKRHCCSRWLIIFLFA